MMGIGIFEMIIIAGIALVVIGPEKFPDFAKLAVRTIRELRGYMDDLKTEVNKELKPVKEELRSLKDHNPEKYIDTLTKPVLTPFDPAAHDERINAAKKEEAQESAATLESGVETDPPAPNPEPDEGAWQRQEYKVAGGDEFEDANFKGPERLD